MVGLHDMLQQCGLLAVAAQEGAEAAEGTEGKRPMVGPYGCQQLIEEKLILKELQTDDILQEINSMKCRDSVWNSL